MELSDSLDIMVGGVGIGSFDAELSVVVFKYVPLHIDVVYVDSINGVDSDFDRNLGGLLTVTEDFDAEVSALVLKYFPLCLDMVDVDGVAGIFDEN